MSKAQWIKDNLKAGEEYAGISLGKDGAPDQHLILLPGEAEQVSWKDAIKWAAKAGGELPTRREQSLLCANLKEHFQPRWYWSSEQYAPGPDYAWRQDFSDGGQDGSDKSYAGRARAVRRLLVIQ
jgi:hypothetical protein